MAESKGTRLYQVNTRVRLSELQGTLDDIPDRDLDFWSARGFDWAWLLGVWQTGPAGRQAALADSVLRAEFRRVLTDFQDNDVCGSCFAIAGYTVHTDFGGDAALKKLRGRLRERGIRLMLDFVPNHTATDHPWVQTHLEYYVHGTEGALLRAPRNYCRVASAGGSIVLAHGRDPNFSGWRDTLQLNYAEPSLQQAMTSELLRISEMCDGVRCDMAMLLLPEVFERTWGVRPRPFWSDAIRRVRVAHPEFTLMAEVYWDLEWRLQQDGFDYTYDKRLYDRLRNGASRPVRDHLRADPEFQRKSVRFLENHDEERAAAVFPPDQHRAAAVIAFFCPGLRFLHDGQLEGRKIRVPVQLCRRPQEPVDADLQQFYERLLNALPEGECRLLECTPAWENNPTWDCFIVLAWSRTDGRRMLAVVNYAPNRSQCYVRLPFEDLCSRTFRLKDLMGPEEYSREGGPLYLDLPPWGYNVFDLLPA